MDPMRNVTLRQLRVFAAVARRGSITGAAQHLNVTPPAVTLQMQQLQEQVGLALIERSPAGMAPTAAGRELLETVRQVEAVLADCGAVLAGLAGSERGTIHTGVISTAEYFAPRALAAFARTHPGIELQLTVGNRAEIIAGLRGYELDIAIMGYPPGELNVAAEVIGEHPHVVVARSDHELAGRKGLPPSVLGEETFLTREPGSGTRGLMERFFADSRITPRIGMQIGSNETIKQAVIAGLGIAFLSGHTVAAEIADGRLVVLDVRGLPIVREWYVVNLRDRRLMPAARVLRQFLAEQGREFLPRINTERT